MSAARRAGQLVILRLRDVRGVPDDLAPIALVYTRGEAQDVLVLTDDGEQTLRLEFATPMEQEAFRVAAIYADPPPDEAPIIDRLREELQWALDGWQASDVEANQSRFDAASRLAAEGENGQEQP